MIGAVVLAAGDSTRMGRPKAALLWRGLPFVGHVCAALRAAGVTQMQGFHFGRPRPSAEWEFRDGFLLRRTSDEYFVTEVVKHNPALRQVDRVDCQELVMPVISPLLKAKRISAVPL